ncbi:Tc toxin subunit A (plasmid) [Rhizobium sp. T1470]|uniref:Tc toxin subunit A n=1 Tax=unclassified Rhizobium TaxID=2613769 RepID=UPI001AAFD89D|nr:Tc toxin subunit A [Rhizobium sp. T1473]MCA0806384.1 Tc toxin subunit A [Rhizobium sp. T1473]
MTGNFPSYQDLFGSLNYTSCDDCESIFGPAAYFLDIMRIVDDRITAPNKSTPSPIPAGHSLPERRPDLFEIALTCSSAMTPISYLSVVNKVMSTRLRLALSANPDQKLATALYPFNLPFNLPLSELRKIVAVLKSSLPQVYSSLLRPGDAGGRMDVARETIGLTVEQLAIVATPHDTADAVAPFYGLANGSALVTELASFARFMERTGLGREAVQSLLYEDLSETEIKDGLANTFFIDATGEADPPVALEWDASNPENPVEKLTGLTVKRLDRISRFVRLATVLGWDFASLDWAMKSVGAAEIADAIEPLAAIKTAP